MYIVDDNLRSVWFWRRQKWRLKMLATQPLWFIYRAITGIDLRYRHWSGQTRFPYLGSLPFLKLSGIK